MAKKKATKFGGLWLALTGALGALVGAGATLLLTRRSRAEAEAGEPATAPVEPASLPPGTRERLRIR